MILTRSNWGIDDQRQIHLLQEMLKPANQSKLVQLNIIAGVALLQYLS